MSEPRAPYETNPQPEYILDRWPRFQTCGKVWKIESRINWPGKTNCMVEYQTLRPDCDCPIAETEGAL
jgi:hypothetical protein